MKKREIEKRCRKEMQQSIPDMDALWMRIEKNLPEKNPETVQPIQKTTSHFRQIAGIAACFLIVLAGISVFTGKSGLKEEKTDPETGMNNAAEMNGYDEETEKTTGMRTYESLAVQHTARIAGKVDLTKLGTDGMYFDEDTVMEQADCFVDVQVKDGEQDARTGLVTYKMQVVDVYGDSALSAGDTVKLTSCTAYILEADHEYVLPLYSDGGRWQLAGECAPQLERTQDGRVVFHSGWYSLMREWNEPLQYKQSSADDYFYDRMYLTDFAMVEAMLKDWAETA